MEGFDISSIIGGLDPSQWGAALASAGISPDALTANADAAPIGGMPPSPWGGGGEAAPMGGMAMPASAPVVGGAAAPIGGAPPPLPVPGGEAAPMRGSPWEPEPVQGSPAGPPVQADAAAAAASTTPAVTQQPSLVNALRGMVAPTVPQPQKVSSPAVARPTGHIQSGELISLLGHLGMLRGAQMPSSYQLPSTLGAALGGGR